MNERVAGVGSRDDEVLSFLCECADDFCVAQVPLRRTRFLEIAESCGYVLSPGHRATLSGE